MKKGFKVLLLLLLIVLTGCGGKGGKDTKLHAYFYGNDQILETIEFEKGEIILPPEIELEGYKILGWYYEPTFVTPFEGDSFEKDVNIYAKLEAFKFQVSFYTHGGTTIPAITIEYGKVLTLPTTPTRVGYEFIGWYLDKDYTELFDENRPIKTDLVLHAKWEEIELPLVDTNEYDAYYIVTSYGYDSSTTVNINYHTKNIKTSVEYTEVSDSNYQNKKIIQPTMKAFESTSDEMEKIFEIRNVCRVTLSNLKPATQYKYRINKGDGTYTEDYYFKTSGDNVTSYVFMTDIHYYDGYDGAEVSEEVISKAREIQPNIGFIVTTGDLVDTGGNADDWDKFFTHSYNIKELPFFTVPGNHEHYYVGSMKNKIFASYFNYPQNGIGDYIGASYYFKYNNVLLVMIDTDLPYNQGEQLQWLDKVITENKQDFIIVGTHAPMNIVGNIDYNRQFMNIMEKHAVDLVLCGHSHTFNFKTTYLDEAPFNNQIGVSYLRGAGGGVKGVGDENPLTFAKGYIIDVEEKRIVIRAIDGTGKIITTRYANNYKLEPKQDATKQELLDSIIATPNLEKGNITFSWSNKFYKNVKNVVILEVYRDQKRFETIVPTPGYVQHTFTGFTGRYDCKYTMTITFNDGTVETKEFEYLNKGGIGAKVDNITSNSARLTYEVTEADKNTLKTYNIYLNGELFATYNATNSSNNFQHVTEYSLIGLKANTEYVLKIEVIGRIGYLYSQTLTFKTK